MRPSTTTTIKGKSEEEILEMITQLQQTNKELQAALAVEKKKSQRRRQEASERRAKFKQMVQNLTRKLSDDSSSSSSEEEENDKNDAIGIAEALRVGVVKAVSIKSKEAQSQPVLIVPSFIFR